MIHNHQTPDLDKFLPDKLIQEDLSKKLWIEKTGKLIELEEKSVIVPYGAILEVVSKSYRKNFYNIGFRNHYAALVAIGGVIEEECGFLEPKYCFATLFYTSDKTMISLDFHERMR